MSTVSIDHWGQMSDFKDLKQKYKITDVFLRSLVIKGQRVTGPLRGKKSQRKAYVLPFTMKHLSIFVN